MPLITGQAIQFGGPGHRDVATITIQDLVDNSIFKCHALPQVGYGKNVNWSSNDILGRSVPIFGYQSSGPTTFDLTIPIFGSIQKGDGRNTKHVKEACDWFHSLTYPDYGTATGSTASGAGTSFLLQPPHKVLLTLAEWKTMICIVNNVHIDADHEMWDVLAGLPMAARITISLSEVGISALGARIPPGVADIRPNPMPLNLLTPPP